MRGRKPVGRPRKIDGAIGGSDGPASACPFARAGRESLKTGIETAGTPPPVAMRIRRENDEGPSVRPERPY